MAPDSHALLEREVETEVIGNQLDRAVAGNGSLVVVEGPAGIGKTTLLRKAMDMGRERGMRVVYGRGGVLERQIEFGVVRQMLEKALVGASDAEREALFAGPAAPAAAVLGFADLPADAGPGRDTSENILHGLYWLMANLSEAGPDPRCLRRRPLGRRRFAGSQRIPGPPCRRPSDRAAHRGP